jgi:hypothetical protein
MFQDTRHYIPMQLIKVLLFLLTAMLVLVLWGALVNAQAQTPRARAATTAQASAQTVAEPLFHEYKSVQIGMSADDARKKLGTPTQMSDAQDFYIFSETETAQVVYDAAQRVTAISVDYLNGGNAPDYKTIVGTEIETKADGSMYKMVRYPKQGFWVSYNRTASATPIITVTIQKMTSVGR